MVNRGTRDWSTGEDWANREDGLANREEDWPNLGDEELANMKDWVDRGDDWANGEERLGAYRGDD